MEVDGWSGLIEHLLKDDEEEQALGIQNGRDDIGFHDMRLSIRNFRRNQTKEAWSKVLFELREGDVQWMFKNFISANVVVRGGRLPFLALMRIRGTLPYAPSRVLRQFGRKQNVPQVGDMGKYVIDYEEDAGEGRLAIKMERGLAYMLEETEKSLQIDRIERRIDEIDLEIAESLRALHKVPSPAQKENSEEIECLLHKFIDIIKVPENAASVEEDRGVSPERNKEEGRFRATPKDESFWPIIFTQGNGQITLKAHFRNYLWDPEVVSCSTI
ncbi:hypothetical protein HAX54_024196 [Datura stramonium]|uniref:DUF7745 domain-containing protein n=1 Tax=Datura stramonium TaxID=4076 RepID=A0ABS8UZM9_DATST|nr:hypothetical protein [Datura stramonium]